MTIYLRLAIAAISIVVLLVCGIPMPRMFAREAAKTPETAWQVYAFLIIAYLQAALFLFALFQAFRLLGYVARDNALSDSSVGALRRIKWCAVAIGFLMVTGIGWVMILSAGTGEDSAGPVMLGLIGTFASSVVAAAVAVLQAQVQKAIHTGKGALS